MVPGDGVFQENSNKIPRQIRENREIIGFIHPSFANEVLSTYRDKFRYSFDKVDVIRIFEKQETW